MQWFITSVAGKFLSTFVISMIPVIELRGGLPFGIAHGLNYPLALCAAVLGNMLPAPFIILFIRKIFAVVRRWSGRFDRMVSRLEARGKKKSEIIAKYGPLGLVLLVAIPLPGTGCWTGALVAALLDIRLRNALPAIFLGVLISAAIMTLATFGVLGTF